MENFEDCEGFPWSPRPFHEVIGETFVRQDGSKVGKDAIAGKTLGLYFSADFCSCLQNGYIASWYQYASMMYLVDTCTPEDGLVMRTGHLQDRHTQPLQSMMSCDALKLVTYCLKNHAAEALGKWNQTCREAHYTVVACDVDCSAASPRAGGRGGVFTALAAAGAVLAAALMH